MFDYSAVPFSKKILKILKPIILLLLLLIWGVVWVDISESTNSVTQGFTNLESNIAPLETVAPEPTDTPESTATLTPEPTDTPEPTATLTPEPTDTSEPTATFTAEPTDTLEPTATSTETVEPTATATETVEPTETATETAEPTATATETAEPTETATETVEPTAIATETAEPTETATETAEPTAIATETAEPTETATETIEPTAIATETVEPTETATETIEPTAIATETSEPTETATETIEPTVIATETVEPTATATETVEPTPTSTETLVPTETSIPTATETLVPTETLIPTATETLVPTATQTPSFPKISIDNAEIVEGDSGSKKLKFVISRSSNVWASSVKLQTINNSANGSDYTPISGKVVNFSKGGSLKQTVSVTIVGDDIVEPNETFIVQLSSPVNAVLDKKQGVGTIKNDDSSQLIVTGGESQSEKDSGTVSYSYQAKLTNPVQGTFTVNYAVKDGSAKVSDGDFSKSSGTLTFSSSGQQSQSFSVTTKGDQKVEGDETFKIALTSSMPSGVSAVNNSTTSTIQNDDSATLKLSGAQAQNEGDSGTKNYIFTVSVDNPVQGGFDVNFKTTGNSATAGSDFEDNDGKLTFAGGQNENRTITVAVKGDELIEADEDFVVELVSISGTALASDIEIGTSSQTGIINNDDFAFLTLIGGQEKIEGDSGTTEFEFKVTLNGTVPGGFDVAYSTDDKSAVSGEDYVDNDGTLKFEGTDGEIQSVTVLVKGDTKAEAHEQFEFSLGEITAPNGDIPINVAGNPQIGTITNDDGAVIFLDIGSVFVTEFTATKMVSVTLSNVSQLPFTVDYDIVEGTAMDGEDYSNVAGTLNFAAGEQVKVIEIPIIDDDEVEENESFTVLLSNPSEFDLGNPSSSVITILDNDSTPVLNLSSVIGEVVESDGSISIELELSQPYALPVIATLNLNDGTARSGADFSPMGNEVVFEPGETVQSIELSIVADVIYERNEDLTIEVVSVTNGDLGEKLEMLVKIIEDDPIPSFAIGGVTTSEALVGLSVVEFMVEISHLSEIDMFVDFETADGSAKAYEDYLPVSGRLRIRAGSQKGTIGVPILGDTISEGDETFSLNFSNRSEGQIDSPNGVLTVTGVIKNVEVHRTFFPIVARDQ